MKQVSKRLISMLLAVVMVVSLLPLAAFAEEEEPAPSGETTCTVTFDSDGGSEVASQTVEAGQTVTEPAPAPVREGYDFAGWFDGENLWNFEEGTVSGERSLKAVWTEKQSAPEPTEGEEPGTPKDPETAFYTVNHYLQDDQAEGGYTLAEAEPKSGNVGENHLCRLCGPGLPAGADHCGRTGCGQYLL